MLQFEFECENLRTNLFDRCRSFLKLLLGDTDQIGVY